MHAPGATQALVVGAGIGGLCTAIALRRCGVQVRVVDRATDLAPTGAGLTLWPNAIRALRRLGLAEAVSEVGHRIPAGGIRSRDGALLLGSDPAALERRVGEPTLAVHRADLQAVLLEALAGEPPDLGMRLEDLDETAGGVTARFAGAGEEHVDLLVGADGLDSVVRAHVIGDGPPRPAGYGAWRGIAGFDATAVPVGELWGPGAVFGFVPLGPDRVYWFGTRPSPGRGSSPEGGCQREAIADFDGWHPQVQAVLRATREEDVLFHEIVDRDPRHGWSRSRITLLGDAAHPMTPHLRQGACQAIEDAVALADCLAEDGDLAASLRSYEEARFARTAAMVIRSRRIGRIAQMRNPLLRGLRDTALRLVPGRVQLGQLEAMVGS